MNTRRRFVIVLGASALAAACPSSAQQTRKTPVVGVLHPGLPPPGSGSAVVNALEQGLRDSGYVVGQNIAVEFRWGGGRPEALPGLALELVKLKVDVLYIISPAAIRAARAVAGTLPIIATDLESDPVASGLVASLAKPGGNLTGLFLDFPAITGKWLEMLTETVPGVRRAAVLWDTTTNESQLSTITAAAKKLSIALDVARFQQLAEIETVLHAALKKRPQALVQLSSPLVNGAADRIASFTQANRLPSISMFTSFPENGGLMSFGPNLPVLYRRIVPLIDKILKGTKPGDIPIERPTIFELVVNMKTAKALGLKVPNSILVRADKVIE